MTSKLLNVVDGRRGILINRSRLIATLRDQVFCRNRIETTSWSSDSLS
jgi:hypothetical protein